MIWLNGNILDEGRIAPSDRGFLLGDGVFETIYADASGLAYFEEHWSRLSAALELLDMNIAFSGEEVRTAGRQLAGHGIKGNDAAALRLSVSRDAGGRGLAIAGRHANWLMAASPCPPPQSVRLYVSSQCRPSRNLTSRIKSLSYLDNVLARREAVDCGADEALLLNECGHVSCAAAANVFIHDGREWITPPEEDGVLPGIIRAEILKRGTLDGSAVIEKSFTLEAALEARHVFICNSLTGAVAVSQINGRKKEKPPALQAISEIHKQPVSLSVR